MTRRTFSGFATRASAGAGQREKRGRFVVECEASKQGVDAGDDDAEGRGAGAHEGGVEGAARTLKGLGRPSSFESCAGGPSCRDGIGDWRAAEGRSFADFVHRDRWQHRRRLRLLRLALPRYQIVDCASWAHLSPGSEQGQLRVEPAILRAGPPRRSIEYFGGPAATPVVAAGASGDSAAVVFTRRAITTLLAGAGRKRSPDVLYVLTCVLLSVVDRRQERACLLLHVAFGLALPPTIAIENHRIPDLVGGLSAGLLKKKSNYAHVNRIFLRALDEGMEAVCLMLLDAGFPRSVDQSIFVPESGSGTHVAAAALPQSVLPSYLLLAAALGLSKVVRAMLAKGGSVTATWHGLTPLILAQQSHNPKACAVITRSLLDSGADPCAAVPPKSIRRLRRAAAEPSGSDLDCPVGVGGEARAIYAIDFAAAGGNCDATILLLNRIVARDPGHIASSRLCLLVQSDVDITIRLLKGGADVGQEDSAGNTALHFAARAGKTDVVAVLFHAGADIDATNSRGWTPLHEAVYMGNRSAVQYLITKGADCSIESREGETALQVALRRGISADDLVEYFAKMNSEEEELGEIRELISQVDSFQLSDEAAPLMQRKNKRRFLIEKIISLPKQWLSNISAAREEADEALVANRLSPDDKERSCK